MLTLLTLTRKIITKFTKLTPFQNIYEEINVLKEQNKFLLFEVSKLNELLRGQTWKNNRIDDQSIEQTHDSFEFQWSDINTGYKLPSDTEFMSAIQENICLITDSNKEWFKGKKILDLGCGTGRFTYGFLTLGARVTACDQSKSALQQAQLLCHQFADQVTFKQIDILTWNEEDYFEMVFCFGVVHHTGNTYQAIENAAKKVKEGGKLFLMVYGFPESPTDFIEVNTYESLRQKLRNFSIEERKYFLEKKFGIELAHGYFDAVSPKINDLLTFPEIEELLKSFGFASIKRTLPSRNYRIIAEKIVVN